MRLMAMNIYAVSDIIVVDEECVSLLSVPNIATKVVLLCIMYAVPSNELSLRNCE